MPRIILQLLTNSQINPLYLSFPLFVIPYWSIFKNSQNNSDQRIWPPPSPFQWISSHGDKIWTFRSCTKNAYPIRNFILNGFTSNDWFQIRNGYRDTCYKNCWRLPYIVMRYWKLSIWHPIRYNDSITYNKIIQSEISDGISVFFLYDLKIHIFPPSTEMGGGQNRSGVRFLRIAFQVPGMVSEPKRYLSILLNKRIKSL